MTKLHRIPRAVAAAYEASDDDALRVLLDLKPCEISPLGAAGPCPYAPTSAGIISWAKAVSLRDELEK
jgi:hypothetical protein